MVVHASLFGDLHAFRSEFFRRGGAARPPPAARRARRARASRVGCGVRCRGSSAKKNDVAPPVSKARGPRAQPPCATPESRGAARRRAGIAAAWQAGNARPLLLGNCCLAREHGTLPARLQHVPSLPEWVYPRQNGFIPTRMGLSEAGKFDWRVVRSRGCDVLHRTGDVIRQDGAPHQGARRTS